jgi:hypothetical protein
MEKKKEGKKKKVKLSTNTDREGDGYFKEHDQGRRLVVPTILQKFF